MTAGTALVVMARAGQILLLDREQVRRQMENIGQGMRESLSKVLGRAGKDAIVAGLTLDDSWALAEAEEVALWGRRFKEAEPELQIRAHDSPPTSCRLDNSGG